jgi:trimethylamine---corrinoid protein Co-methyltransferase
VQVCTADFVVKPDEPLRKEYFKMTNDKKKMADRMQTFPNDDLTLIHEASLRILSRTGVDFNNESVAALFKHRGFKTSGTKVFFREKEIINALQSTISEFKLHARNPEYTVDIGNENFVFAPTGGAPNIADAKGNQRLATLADYRKCCKLVQTSDQLDVGGSVMVQPTDIPGVTAPLDMMLSYITLCEKPIFASSGVGTATRNTIEMAGILFGGKEKLEQRPVMTAVVNVMSPLQYAEEQAEVIVEMARVRQPVVITNMILAGASGPVSLPSLLTLGNAEILAGVVLTQIVSPGTPVVYGSTSAPMDMRTMVSAVGAPETIRIASATIQMARFYNLPCRVGGGLTDAHLPDAQALSEGTLMLSTVVRNGANYIYHACGQMGSYISMSFEKWLIDEEVCRRVRQMIEPMEITAKTIDIDTIQQVGIGGGYLTHPKTFEQFRTLSSSGIFNRKGYSKWKTEGARRIEQVASEKLIQRLEDYQKPPLDQGIEDRLHEYVKLAKAGL